MEKIEIDPNEELVLGTQNEKSDTVISSEDAANDQEKDQKNTLLHNIKKWGSLGILCLALAIVIIDTTILNVSLSAIILDLKTNIQGIQWVITAYALTLSALTVTGGRIGDFFGRKRMFVLGAIIFAVGSFIASISSSVGMLLVGESLVEGIGAALMMPATASLIVANFKGHERGIAFGIWGGVAGAASALGPILGGYLTTNYSWRWGFRINLIVVLLLVIGSFIIKESKDLRSRKGLDFVGVILSSIGLMGIVFGIVEASRYGLFFAKENFIIGGVNLSIFGVSIVPIFVILGAMFLNLFYWWERKIEKNNKTPLISFDIFKIRAFSVGVITVAIISLGQVGILFTLPVFLQAVLHLDALSTGIALLPLSLTILVMAPISGFLVSKIPARFIIMTGLIVDVVGIYVLRSEISISSTVLSLVPGLIIFGAGMGMAMAQISNITLSAVSVQQAGEASGISSTMRQVGYSLGTAIIGTVLLSVLSLNLSSGISKSVIIPQNFKSEVISTISSQSSSVEFGARTTFKAGIPQQVVGEVERISKDATIDSVRSSLLYAMFFAFLGFLVSLFLPKHEKPKSLEPIH